MQGVDRTQVADVPTLLGWVTCSRGYFLFLHTLAMGKSPLGAIRSPETLGRSQHLNLEGTMSYSLLFLLALQFCLGSASRTTLTSAHSRELTTPPTSPQATAAWLPPGGTSWAEGGTVSQVRELLRLGELCSISFCSLFGGPEYNFMVD